MRTRSGFDSIIVEDGAMFTSEEEEDSADEMFVDSDEKVVPPLTNNSTRVIDKPTTFLQIPIILLNGDYFMTAIYLKRFLHLSDYELVKVFKKFGEDQEESNRIVLYNNEMTILVELSQHEYLCHDLEIKPNTKGIVLFKLEWLIKMFTTKELHSGVFDLEQPNDNNNHYDHSDFSVLFNLDGGSVEFNSNSNNTKGNIEENNSDSSSEEELEALSSSDEEVLLEEEEEEDTLHTCAIRKQGIEKFQHFLHRNLLPTTTASNSYSDQKPTLRIITPLDY